MTFQFMKTKDAREIWLGVVVCTLIVILSGCGRSNPSAKDIERRMAFDTPNAPVEFLVDNTVNVPEEGGQWRIRFTGHARAKEPLFRAESTKDAVARSANVSGADWDHLRSAMARASSLPAEYQNPLAADMAEIRQIPPTILVQALGKGETAAISGEATAQRSGDTWAVKIESIQAPDLQGLVTESKGKGQPVASSAIVASYAASITKLGSSFPERVDHAEKEYLQAMFAPGKFFVGTYTEGNSPTSTQIALQIETLDVSDKSFTALIRNEGSWADTRRVTGRLHGTGVQTEIGMTLESNTARIDCGPFLQVTDAQSEFNCVLREGKLMAQASAGFPSWKLVLRPASAEERARFEQTARAFEEGVLALVKKGTTLIGVCSRLDGTEPEKLLFHIKSFSPDGGTIEILMQDTKAPCAQVLYRGTVVTNRFAAMKKGAVHISRVKDLDKETAVSNERFFSGDTRDFQFNFNESESGFVLDNRFYNLALKVMPTQALDAWNQEWTARRAQWASALQAGMRYKGMMVSVSQSLAIDLVFTEFEDNGSIVSVRISVPASGKTHTFHGTINLDSVLRRPLPLSAGSTTGENPNTPFGRLANTKLELKLDADGSLVGKISDPYDFKGWAVKVSPTAGNASTSGAQPAVTPPLAGTVDNANVTPSGQASGSNSVEAATTYPDGQGAFLLSNGEWVSLPHNNGYIVRTSKKLQKDAPAGSFVFAGGAPIPEVAGEIAIFFRGDDNSSLSTHALVSDHRTCGAPG